jgi:transcriptional regulator with XRE-family HTH domain
MIHHDLPLVKNHAGLLDFSQVSAYGGVMAECFGERLRRLRKARGLGLKEMAKVADRSEPWMSRLEKGHYRRQPEYPVIVAWADLLGVSPEYLSAGEEHERVVVVRLARPVEPLEAVLARIGAVPIDDDDPTELEHRVAAGPDGGGVVQDGDDTPGPPMRAPHRRSYLVRIVGDCMEPDAFDGDYAEFDPDASPRIGNTVVVADGEHALVKFLAERAGVQYLLPRVGEEIPLRPGMRIVGVVTHFRRKPGRMPRRPR